MQEIRGLCEQFRTTRLATVQICKPLETEDFGVQTCPDVSPPKWHLAHTTWFFEKFILSKYLPGYKVFHAKFDFLFNSYYQTFGSRMDRDTRSLASRPTVKEVLAYRNYIDEHMFAIADATQLNAVQKAEVASLLTLGIHHEQQHQELMYMDILNIFAKNPLQPVYDRHLSIPITPTGDVAWLYVAAGEYNIGYEGCGFFYDNEQPLHRESLRAYSLADRLVTNGEFQDFIDDGGYHKHEHWLADGWDWIRQNDVRHPLYWQKENSDWQEMTLSGLHPLQPREPVKHVSYYEAAAYAHWKKARLPTEAEREVGQLCGLPMHGNGVLWEWTQSPYMAYPGYTAAPGAIGEYNGKFMCNQIVLRGGCFVTAADHARPTYRNFYYPQQRWMFSGIRLAKNEP